MGRVARPMAEEPAPSPRVDHKTTAVAMAVEGAIYSLVIAIAWVPPAVIVDQLLSGPACSGLLFDAVPLGVVVVSELPFVVDTPGP